MKDFTNMERPQSSNNLDKNIPYFLFFNIGFTFLVIADFLIEIAIVSELHN